MDESSNGEREDLRKNVRLAAHRAPPQEDFCGVEGAERTRLRGFNVLHIRVSSYRTGIVRRAVDRDIEQSYLPVSREDVICYVDFEMVCISR
jgi:hypothetical protein